MHNRGVQTEKAKNFKISIKRLFKDLGGFKIFITIALVLSMIGAILSILAPSKLSDITDEISSGLVVNTENITDVTTSITSDPNLLTKAGTDLLSLKIDQDSITKIMASTSISSEAKASFNTLISSPSSFNLEMLANIPDDLLKIILPDSSYKGSSISSSDKITFIKALASNDLGAIPESISSVIFDDIEVSNVTLTSSDQMSFLKEMSTLDKESTDSNELYSRIDNMTPNLKSLFEPAMNMENIKNIVYILVAFYVCSALFTYIESLIMTIVANRYAKNLRNKISIKINKLPLKFFDSHETGDTLSRVTNDVDTIAQSMNQSLATLVSSVTLLIGSVIMMFITNFLMAITAILASIIGFFFMTIILSKSQKHFIAKQRELGNLDGHIEEIYSGLNVVKVYNGKKQADVEFDDYNYKVYEAGRKSQFLSGLMMPMMNFIGNFGYVAVCVVGAMLTMSGSISFGVIVAFISYVRLFTSPLSQIAQSMTSLQSTAAASERVFEFIDSEEMPKEDAKEKLLRKDVKGSISFKDVSFTYDGNETPTIKDFSALAKKGSKVAIVGPTGAGKTTMVNLLMKFYDISSGDILIDNISIKDLTRENVHDLFTMVLQDTWLFDGTIKENIIYNKQNISDEDVHNVCKKIGLDHFIKTLPHGYDSSISNNDSVSAGQRQLLTIARGMLHDAPFLILDEATSNVDTRTEELVQQAMDKLTQGKTSFIIAHRLSTIKNADLILVMKDGNIIEQGNHNELLKKNGFYADLYNSQFEH